MTTHSRKCPCLSWLPLAVTSSLMFALVVAFAPEATAQKTDPKANTKSDAKSDVKGDAKDEPKDAPPARVVDIMVNTHGGVEQVAYINERLDKLWRENKLTSSERCSDYEFIRRASLDIIGRIAKVEEIDRFMKDSPERRRSMLIERLLASD